MTCCAQTRRRHFNWLAALSPVLSFLTVLSVIAAAPAQQLPIRNYAVAQGLRAAWVNNVFQDSKGYIWAISNDFADRFDGYRFENYTAREQLGDSVYFASIAEDHRGRLWFATFGWAGQLGKGVARLIDNPGEAQSLRRRGLTATPEANFVFYPVGDSAQSMAIEKLLFDSDNALWCLTAAGLYRARETSTDDLEFELVVAGTESAGSPAAFADSQGRLWFGLRNELVEVVSGNILRYRLSDGAGGFQINAVTQDRNGRLIAASHRELFEFVESGDPNRRGQWNKIPLALLPKQDISSLAFDSEGALWIGTLQGLIKYSNGRQFLYTTAQGLSSQYIASLCLDREGDLWIATGGGGLSKLSGEMIVSYTELEGLPDRWTSLVRDRQGRIFAVTGAAGIAEIKEQKALFVHGSEAHSYTGNELVVQDRLGNWWIGTTTGLFRYEGPTLQFHRGRKFTKADGIPEAEVRKVFEDSAGQIWVSLVDEYLYRFEPGTRVHPISERERLAAEGFTTGIITMLDDDSGTLWFSSHSQLGRMKDGRITVLHSSDGLPETRVRALFKDSRGWLWMGLRNRGISVTRDPNAEQPVFTNYSTKTGLSGDTIWAITEDNFGRVYLGSNNGIDRLDVEKGQVSNISTKNGLAGDTVNRLIKDEEGNIWAGTNGGVSRYDPRVERTLRLAPPIYFDRVSVAGDAFTLGRGATQLAQGSLAPSHNTVRIEFVGLSFWGEQSLRYQYKLEGIDQDWSPPSEGRSVNYARLDSGSYRFVVRAITREGVTSQQPAVMEFRVLPPIWRRWWFVSIAIAMAGGAVYALYRYRVSRLLELERLKTRIASDLHDEMGSGLGSIGILSELAADDGVDETVRRQLALKIARTSGELGTALGEIVWALHPGSVTLESLAAHLTERAGRLFPGPGTSFATDFPPQWPHVPLSIGVRRNLLLIGTESLHNAARHACAKTVVLGLRQAGKKWVMWISDDGIGIGGDAIVRNGSRSGLGLHSMRRRAEEIGAQISWTSPGGRGSVVTVTFTPLGKERGAPN